MLETITKGFRSARHRLQGYRELDESIVDEILDDIRTSLLEADVEFGVVKHFIGLVREKTLGEVVRLRATDQEGKTLKVSPQDHFIKICHDELEALMGPVVTDLDFQKKGITTVMMVGLQGSGKTTTAGKLANLYKRKGYRPLLIAADIYRPAAIEQLKVLGEKLDVPVFSVPGMSPPDLWAQGYEEARKTGRNLVILDTAGRLTIDQALMDELAAVRGLRKPDNTLLVIDSMIGQDAVRTAKAFHDTVGIDGVVLTKLDGDARGGAALSVKMVTGAPIKFVGMGEGLDKLEEFRPEGMASRILGMGDIVGLMTDFEKVVDEEQAEADAKKMLSGNFTLGDFLEQIKTLKKMGSLRDVMEKLPFFADMQADGAKFDEKELVRIEALIQSMTPKERKRPEVIDASRAKRIALGAGRSVRDVQDLLQRYAVMREMMARIGQTPGLLTKLPGFNQMGNLAKMKGMDVGSFFDELESMPMPDEMGGGGGGSYQPRRTFDRDKRKKKAKLAKQSKKANRKKR
ncbi:MAG: signal recognition particle protein [Deltaproteobacteria bacterium]|nr:signal recognition particle protein [Deltaproteobacteria bacterium]